MSYLGDILSSTAVSSEAWAKLRDWASVAGKGRLLLSGSVTHASLETAVHNSTKSATATEDAHSNLLNATPLGQLCN